MAELIDQIIDCYVNKQLSLEKTIKILNLPFGRNKLKRLLVENGVHIRTYKEAENHGYRGPVPEELVQQIIKLYNSGYSIARIQKEISQFYSSNKIKKILQEHNIVLRTLEEAKKCQVETDERKYSINDDYCLESHNGAWLLGFYAADGYLPNTKGARNRIVLTLARKDENILYAIAEELQYNGPIYQYMASDGIHPISSLSFSSKKLRKKFEEYGVVNNKTLKLHFLPNLSDEFMLDYIRGYFDGDGCVAQHKNNLVLSIISACKDFLEDMRDYLIKHYQIYSKVEPDHNSFRIRFHEKDGIRLGKLMYNNEYLALPRKKEKFYKIISPTSLNTPQE